MSLLSKIRDQSLAARKAKDAVAVALLVTLLSEAERTGLDDGKRESTDTEVTATIRKFLKGNTETIAVRGETEVLVREKAILEAFLPKQLTDDELREAIVAVAAENGIEKITGKETGVIMKALGTRYAGQYAGGQASAIIKALAAG